MQTLDELIKSRASAPVAALESPVHPWLLPFRVVVINPYKPHKKRPATYAYCATEEEAERIAAEQNQLAAQRAADQTTKKLAKAVEMAAAFKKNFPDATAEQLAEMFPPPEPVTPFEYVAIDAKGLWAHP